MTRNELVLGVAIVAIAVSATTALLASASSDEERATAEADARILRDAVEAWFAAGADVRSCPTVSRLVEDDVLARTARTDDPWGARFRVKCDDGAVSIVSTGRDGRYGTDDDIRLTL